MLLSLVIKFTPKYDAILPSANGNYIHGLFFNTLQMLDKDLATKIHDLDKTKPFTVSPIFGEYEKGPIKGTSVLKRDSVFWFRMTLLDKKLSEMFLEFFKDKTTGSFYIAEKEMRLIEVVIDKEKDFWSGLSSHEEIYNKYIVKQEDLKRKITLMFYTPTTFKNDTNNFILPLPKVLFFNILQKWDELSNIPLTKEEFIDWLDKYCVVSRYDIKTRMWDFDKYKFVGFVGDVEFINTEKSLSAFGALWNMLCEYAFWAGIGAKTTMGFGMTSLKKEGL